MGDLKQKKEIWGAKERARKDGESTTKSLAPNLAAENRKGGLIEEKRGKRQILETVKGHQSGDINI